MLIWKDIPGYEGVYRISNLGNIISLSRLVISEKSKRTIKEKELKPSKDKDGYPQVVLQLNKSKKRFYLHILMLTIFGPPKPFDEAVCRHLDGSKDNFQISNLTWGSNVDNMADKLIHGTDSRGYKSPITKLTPDLVKEIKERLKTESAASIAKSLNLGKTTVLRIKHNKGYF